MTENTKPALPDGSRRFHIAFRRQHPELDCFKARQMSNEVLVRMSELMDEGYQPAVAKPQPGGKVQLIILSVERLLKGKRRE